MTPTHVNSPGSTTLALPVLGGVVAGFGISTFGLAWPWVAAVVLVVISLAVKKKRILFLLAAGVGAGALLYVGLGLMMNLFDAPSAGTGSG